MATFTIEAHELTNRTGQWCDHCALPSVIEADLAVVATDTLRVLTRLTASLCTLCGREDTWR